MIEISSDMIEIWTFNLYISRACDRKVLHNRLCIMSEASTILPPSPGAEYRRVEYEGAPAVVRRHAAFRPSDLCSISSCVEGWFSTGCHHRVKASTECGVQCYQRLTRYRLWCDHATIVCHLCQRLVAPLLQCMCANVTFVKPQDYE